MKQDRNRRARRDREPSFLCVLCDLRGFFLSRVMTHSTGADAGDRSGGGRTRETLLVEQCGFCHGANARGGSGGPDITRSAMVEEDAAENSWVRFFGSAGPSRDAEVRPARRADGGPRRPSWGLGDYLDANRRRCKILDIVVGDPKAGEAYFTGAGRCSSGRFAERRSERRWREDRASGAARSAARPRGRAGGSGPPSYPVHGEEPAIKVTVTLPSGESPTGRPRAAHGLRRDPGTTTAAGRVRSFWRNGDVPKVVVTDRLQAHVDRPHEMESTEMHNMTAYLASQPAQARLGIAAPHAVFPCSVAPLCRWRVISAQIPDRRVADLSRRLQGRRSARSNRSTRPTSETDAGLGLLARHLARRRHRRRRGLETPPPGGTTPSIKSTPVI